MNYDARLSRLHNLKLQANREVATDGGTGGSDASASLIPDGPVRSAEAQARRWKRLEHWSSRVMWAVVTVTLLVDLVATFGHSPAWH